MASLGEGRTAPGDSIQGVTPEWNFFFGRIYKKNTKQTTLEGGEGGSCDETMAKEVITF